ncbi:hypothetical protein TWF281_003111 [Arthrobotrys megalospora]
MCRSATCNTCNGKTWFGTYHPPTLHLGPPTNKLLLVGPCSVEVIIILIGNEIGCGLHKSSILDTVPKEEWCTCEKKPGDTQDEYPPMGSMPSSLRPHETPESIAKDLLKKRNEWGGIPKEPPQQQQQQMI